MASRPAPTPSHFSSSVYLGDLSQLFQEIDAIENGATSSTNTNTNLITENSHNMTTTSSFPILPSETPTYNEYHPQLTNMIPSTPESSQQPHQQHPPFLYDNYTTTPENDLVDPHVGSMQIPISTLDFSPHLYLYDLENTASMASTQHVPPPPPQPDPQPSLTTSMTSPTTSQYDDTCIAPTTPQYTNDTTTYNTQGRSITFATDATSNGYLLQQTDALSAWRSQQASMTSLSRKTSRSSMGGGGGGGALSRSNSRSSNGRYQYRSRTSSSSGSAITLYSNNNETHQCIVPGCNKTFSRKRDIWRHFFFVHKGMPFMHMGAAIMSGWQFTCEKCGKDYSRKDSLKRHQQKKHPELFDSSSSSKNKK